MDLDSDPVSTSNPDDGERGGTSRPSESDMESKAVHSLVEKKRRDKMTQYVTELSTMIPMCGAMQRKLDKITVLRMAVQHLKAIKGSKLNPSGESLTSSPLADESLMKAILGISDCFLFVVACDRGKFLYVSESVSSFINCTNSDLIGQSIFDILHPKDVAKVKEQLIASDVTAREVFIDAKTMEPVDPGVIPKPEVKVTSSGAARSFFCRMKNKPQAPIPVKPEPNLCQESARRKKQAQMYTNLQCTGFIKTWASSKVAADGEASELAEVGSCNLACLVAVARLPPRLHHQLMKIANAEDLKSIQFYGRLNYEYKFSVVDPTVTYVTGFLPQEVVGNSVFEFFISEDIPQLRELLTMTRKTSEKIVSPVLHMRQVNDEPSICVRVVLSSFKNPFTSELEHTLLDITAVPSARQAASLDLPPPSIPQSLHNAEDAASKHTSQSGSYSCSLLSHTSAEDEEATKEASMAIVMSVLEADGGLGGVMDERSLLGPFE